jgi:hypothetical protein
MLIKDIFNEYKTLYESNLVEFGNKTLTSHMHTLCDISDLIRKYSKISVYNSQAIEELNNIIKQQISSNNNNYDTTKSFVKYFSRNNFLLDSSITLTVLARTSSYLIVPSEFWPVRARTFSYSLENYQKYLKEQKMLQLLNI